MPNYGPGNTLYHVERHTSSASFTPQEPYGARVTKVQVASVSARDIWRFSVNGQEVGAYFVGGAANFQLLQNATFNAEYVTDIFSLCRALLGRELTYSVPQGQTLTIKSDAGATGDIAVEYEEVPPNTLGTTLVNHPQGTRWLAATYPSIQTSVAAAGDIPFDTEDGLSFVPKLFTGAPFQQGWSASILALFATARTVNTYDGSADHISRSEYIGAKINGQTMFTRDDAGGIPLVADDAGTGSANATSSTSLSPLTSFGLVPPYDFDSVGLPIMVRPGYSCKWHVGVTGDVTGGADYSPLPVVAIVEYVEQQ